MLYEDQKKMQLWLTAVGAVLLAMLLMLAGCGPYIQDAVRADDAAQLQQMMDRGADSQKKGFKGETLLHVAANSNAVEAGRLLIAAGLEVDARDRDGRTPLHLAAFKGYAEMTALLVENGADATLVDNLGRTPLHLARVGGYPELVRLMAPETETAGPESVPQEEDWVSLGNRFAMEGKYEAAVRAYRLGLKLYGEDEKVYYNLGLCLWRLEQKDDALQAFQSALRIDPGYGRAYYNMGVIYGEQTLYHDAMLAFQAAVRIAPDDGEAWYNLGNCYDSLKRYDLALDAWEKALQADAAMPAPHFNLAVLLKRLGRLDQARAHYDLLKTTHPEMAAELAQLFESP